MSVCESERGGVQGGVCALGEGGIVQERENRERDSESENEHEQF